MILLGLAFVGCMLSARLGFEFGHWLGRNQACDRA